MDFDTPDRENGDANTQAMVNYNSSQGIGLTASNCAFMWASSLGEGWYLPAIDELAAMAPNLDKVRETLATLGWDFVTASGTTYLELWSSTTEVTDGATTKTIYSYDFNTNEIVSNQARDAGSEYFGFVNARAFKKVTKE